MASVVAGPQITSQNGKVNSSIAAARAQCVRIVSSAAFTVATASEPQSLPNLGTIRIFKRNLMPSSCVEEGARNILLLGAV